jgi:hypothetical protein
MKETCAICGCKLHRARDTYAKPTIQGRSHASAHHFIAERFFGRSKNRQGTQRVKIFERCPWGHEGKQAFFCYDCHEEVLHNPVFLPDDIERLSKIVKARDLSEETKTESRDLLAKRIELLHEIISRGLLAVEKDTK